MEIDRELAGQVAALAMDQLRTATIIPNKMERQKTLDALLDEIKQKLKNDDPLRGRQISTIFLISKKTKCARSFSKRTSAPTAENRTRSGRSARPLGSSRERTAQRSLPGARRRPRS